MKTVTWQLPLDCHWCLISAGQPENVGELHDVIKHRFEEQCAIHVVAISMLESRWSDPRSHLYLNVSIRAKLPLLVGRSQLELKLQCFLT